jgi:hypothetical protein
MSNVAKLEIVLYVSMSVSLFWLALPALYSWGL